MLKINKYQNCILWYVREEMKIVNVKKQQIPRIILWYTHRKMKIVNVKKQQNSMLNVEN